MPAVILRPMALFSLVAVLSSCAEPAATVSTSGMPTAVGQCAETQITQVGNRLRDTPGSGSDVTFANGGYQVSYGQEFAVDSSRPGDPVRMCLVSIPEDCPPGDDRGRVYTTTNLRTGLAWSLADASHICGGA